jgi:ApbE superfamily uncharacterized protein (UPF0280 family)
MSFWKQKFRYNETVCTLLADKKEAIDVAIDSIKHNRRQLDVYCRCHPHFLESLEPVPVPPEPPIAKLMAEAARTAGVGPMAAVAGALADLAVKAMKSTGCKVAVVENGGEVSAISDQTIDVALSAGDSGFSKRFGFRLTDFPVGIATSSGVFSHALSFGDAEAVTIFSSNAALADAAATAVCNVVKGGNPRKAIEFGLRKALSIDGVKGVLIIYQKLVGTAGNIPQIIKVNL